MITLVIFPTRDILNFDFNRDCNMFWGKIEINVSTRTIKIDNYTIIYKTVDNVLDDMKGMMVDKVIGLELLGEEERQCIFPNIRRRNELS